LKGIDSREIRSRSEESEIKEMRGGSFNPFMLYRVSTVLLQTYQRRGGGVTFIEVSGRRRTPRVL
jgi:hypothetical protein